METLSAGQMKCSMTLQQIIGQANPASDPAWVNYFMATNARQGLPVVIGDQASLYTYVEPGNGVRMCELTFDEPSSTGTQVTLYFAVGYVTFSGANQPTLTTANGPPSQPKVEIGPDGELLPPSSAIPPTVTSSSSTSAATTTPATPQPFPRNAGPGAAPVLDVGNGTDTDIMTCAHQVFAGLDTSCPFAENVYAAITRARGRLGFVPHHVTAYSPITKRSYTLTCDITNIADIECFTSTNPNVQGATVTMSYYDTGPPPSQRATTTTSQTSTTAVIGRAATAAEIAALTTVAQAGGELIAGYSLDDVTVTNNGWAQASLLASNPQDQGDGVLILRQTAGRWQYVTGGSSNFQGVPTAVLKALFQAARSRGNQ